jgi:hypothetical protein
MKYVGLMINAYTILVGRSEGKRSLWRPKCTRKDNIKIYLREVYCGIVDWIYLADDSDQWWDLVNTMMNLLFTK